MRIDPAWPEWVACQKNATDLGFPSLGSACYLHERYSGKHVSSGSRHTLHRSAVPQDAVSRRV